MPHSRQRLGNKGEQAARNYLESKGYAILDSNWHAGRYGEIDIIAQQGDEELIFVEVKTRHSTSFGYPEEAVNKAKILKLQAAAQAFILSHPQLPEKIRFDVVAVILSTTGEVMNLKHYQSLLFGS